jgi:hypothetical protein
MSTAEQQTEFLFVFFSVLGLYQPFFVMDFFEIGSCELFARAGFQP